MGCAAGFAIPLWVVAVVYLKDLAIAVGAIALLSLAGKLRISARPIGKASTVLQFALVMAVLLAPGGQVNARPWWLPMVKVLWWGVAVLGVASCVDYAVQGWRQYEEARVRRAGGTGEPVV